MLLENKNAVIYGAGGAIGSAVSRAFAREGANVFLAGRTLASLDAVARDISAAGGVAETAQVDALDEQSVGRHAAEVAGTVGGIDVSFNLISVSHLQGTPLVELALDDFAGPVTTYMKTHFLTARAAARHMDTRPGVILMMTTTPDRNAIPLVGPFGVVLAAIEALSRTLAAELGPRGIRVACLRSTGSPESPGVQEAFAHHAEAAGGTPEEFQASLESSTMLHRLTTLDEVAAMAAFIASDRASATTGAVVNLTCGSVID
jgi:3-oxoacyl-[acyl-carrier protein] reductase